jgi:site-specific recombinase XerD
MFLKKGISADRILFSAFDYDTLMEFFEWIENDRGCSILTKNQRLSAIVSFSEYAQNRDFEAASVFRSSIVKIPSKKAKGKPRAVFSTEEVKVLLRLPDVSRETGLRDKVLLNLMYASGARAQEICDLTVCDVQFQPDRHTTLQIYGKGGKRRRIGISDTCAEMLQKYIVHRKLGTSPDRHLFSSQTNEKMSVSCIEAIYKKYVHLAKKKNADLFQDKNYSPHSMRHATASHMLEAGVPIVVIKNFLGHVSIQSTQVYAELSQSVVDIHLREWNEKWFPKDVSIEESACAVSKIPDFLSV